MAEKRGKKRRAGDPWISDGDRAILARMTDGDLADEFQAALDAAVVTDSLLGGHDDHAA